MYYFEPEDKYYQTKQEAVAAWNTTFFEEWCSQSTYS